MFKSSPNGKQSGRIAQFIHLLNGTHPPWRTFLLALALSLIHSVMMLAIPLLTKGLVNGLSVSEQAMPALSIGSIAAVLTVLTVSGFLSVYLLQDIGNRTVSALREQLWRKILSLPVPLFDKKESGEIVSRLTNDTAVVKNLITNHLAGFLSGILSITGALIILFTLQWKLALVVVVTFPLFTLVAVPLGRLSFKLSKLSQDENARLASIAMRAVSDIRLVKASGAESAEFERGMSGIANLFRLGRREARMQATVSPIISLLMMVLLMTVFGFGGVQVASGAMTAGDLVAFILYLFQIVLPITQIIAFVTGFQAALGATDSLMALLNAADEDRDSGSPILQADLPIVIDNVTFAYQPDKEIIRNLSLTIEAGKTTAIVGPSGGGKSTLFSLLERFYVPNAGAIRFGDWDIRQYSIRSWRETLGYVAQDHPLIAGTIRENILYGLNRQVTAVEMEVAVRMAYADAFIHLLPQGYDTEVGERGIKLPGGQRQRLAIARALLRNPRILLLDEATSNLDSSSEAIVQQALHKVMEGRTTIVIAHRLATVIKADRIYFVEHGQITGVGTHKELYAAHSQYREFADHQLRSFQPA